MPPVSPCGVGEISMARRPDRYVLPHGHRIAPSIPTEFYEIEKRPAAAGLGAFSAEPIEAGAVVLRDGGIVVESPRLLPRSFFGYQAMVDHKAYLSPPDHDALEATWFLNHHCNANLARFGGLIYVAKRPVAAGEELTVDYSPFVACRDNWQLKCKCGDESCRRVVSSEDWKNPVLAKRLWREWLPFVQKKILKHRILEQKLPKR